MEPLTASQIVNQSNHLYEEIYWPNVKTTQDIQRDLGHAPAKISVRNLQATIRVGKDAWGREGKVQPVLISATVSLRQHFGASSAQDKVNKSTIHYGTLSKAILEAAQELHDQSQRLSSTVKNNSVRDLIFHIEGKLAPESDVTTSGCDSDALLDRYLVSSLELEITLPKALLNSTIGVSRLSVKELDVLGERREYEQEYWSMSIVLRDLRVSTLIGVNPNERLAKQLVIANIELDVWVTKKDVYNELEAIAVKTIEESSFETLESLATHLAWRITRYFVHPHFVKNFETGDENENPYVFPRIKIALSKPTAVTLADAPVVEVLVESSELLKRAPPCRTALPFPLQSRLDEWMVGHDLEGLSKDPVLGS